MVGIFLKVYLTLETFYEVTDLGDESGSSGAQDAKIEQLMVNMLEDRDKLQEQLEAYKRTVEEHNTRLRELERERDSWRRQFELQTQHLPGVSPWGDPSRE